MTGVILGAHAVSILEDVLSDKKKVLAVDDEMHMRIFLRTLLETNGYHPMLARNGLEGIETARKTPPDLIILDVMMPNEGGAKMYHALKSDDALKAIPVIMLSGVTEEAFVHYLNMFNIRLETPLPEPAAYMEKPPEAKDLLELIEENLGGGVS